jgi:hypothetical protein
MHALLYLKMWYFLAPPAVNKEFFIIIVTVGMWLIPNLHIQGGLDGISFF